jgi:pyruvate/2-oxoglutarate dehydrogenase complex dihydrolipoamide acyltransferase (E2) component
LEFRIVAEAINTKGGESLARAVVDVPPPLEKTTINKYTRFLSRKLMDGMMSAWLVPASAQQQEQPAPPPAAQAPAQPPPPVAPQSAPPPPAPAPAAAPSTSPAGTTTFLP